MKEKICFTVAQAAMYAHVHTSIIREWLSKQLLTLVRTDPKTYEKFIDPDELDALLRFRETFQSKQWVREWRNAQSLGLSFDHPIPTWTHTTIQTLVFHYYAFVEHPETCVRAVCFNTPFRVISGEYVAKSPPDGGWLLRWHDPKIHLRQVSKDRFEVLLQPFHIIPTDAAQTLRTFVEVSLKHAGLLLSTQQPTTLVRPLVYTVDGETGIALLWKHYIQIRRHATSKKWETFDGCRVWKMDELRDISIPQS